MRNKIYINNILWINEEKSGRNVFVILENKNKIPKSSIKDIEIECQQCHCRKHINFYNGLLKRDYLCQSCNLTGERNPFFGKVHSQELKDRLSKERKGVWGVGEKNAMYGINPTTLMTEEQIIKWKEKISNSLKGEKNHMYGKKMKDIVGEEKLKEIQKKSLETRLNFSPEKKKEIGEKLSLAQKRFQKLNPELYKELKARGGRASKAKLSNFKMNQFEKKIDDWLTEHNIEHIFSPIMQHTDKNNYQFDFIIKSRRILIECQGTYWHGDPRFYNIDGSNNKKKLNEMQIIKQQKDKKKKEFAESHNFKLIEIWEEEVKNNDFSTLEKELL